MKYAIVYKIRNNSYLKGFTNTPIDIINSIGGRTYTVELKELDSMFIALEGDAAIYLS